MKLHLPPQPYFHIICLVVREVILFFPTEDIITFLSVITHYITLSLHYFFVPKFDFLKFLKFNESFRSVHCLLQQLNQPHKIPSLPMKVVSLIPDSIFHFEGKYEKF